MLSQNTPNPSWTSSLCGRQNSDDYLFVCLCVSIKLQLHWETPISKRTFLPPSRVLSSPISALTTLHLDRDLHLDWAQLVRVVLLSTKRTRTQQSNIRLRRSQCGKVSLVFDTLPRDPRTPWGEVKDTWIFPAAPFSFSLQCFSQKTPGVQQKSLISKIFRGSRHATSHRCQSGQECKIS